MKRYKKILLSILGICIILGTTTFAAEIITDTQEISKVDKRDLNLQAGILSNWKKESLKRSNYKIKLPKYDIRETLMEDLAGVDIDVENQYNTGLCAIFSLMTTYETTHRIMSGKYQNIAAPHFMYAMSDNFNDGEYKYGLRNNPIEDGLSIINGLSYFTNGTGPINESEMPLNKISSLFNKISVLEVEEKTGNKVEFPNYTDKAVSELKFENKNGESKIVTGWKMFVNGEESVQKQIKEHLSKYGAVQANIYFDESKYYDEKSHVYYCDDSTVRTNHAVTIIGWDDNFEIEKFNSLNGNKPTSKGAYIVQNSFGKDFGDNGIFYVSYEDKWIEDECYGITEIDYKNYYKLYQYDAQGPNDWDDLKNLEEIKNIKSDTVDSYYVVNTYDRVKTDKEYLDKIGITLMGKSDYEIYVIPNYNSISDLNDDTIKKYIVHKNTFPINNEYTVIQLEKPVELVGNKFAVLVKYKKTNNENLNYTIINKDFESEVEDGNTGEYKKVKILENYVEVKENESFIGFTLNNMVDIGKKGKKACIKVFTQEVDNKYNTKNIIPVKTKNQGRINNCWIYPVLMSAETNVALNTLQEEEYSTRHMDYATSQSIKIGTNENTLHSTSYREVISLQKAENKYKNELGFNRTVNTEGTTEWGLAYLTNGSGPIYEISMPFREEFGDIDLNELQGKTVVRKVKDWIQFPEIIKTVQNGTIKYTKNNGKEYTEFEIQEIRNQMKLHIKNYGSIATETYIDGRNQYYNKATKAYYCDDPSKQSDHGIGIIGWDDNFSKDNFMDGHKPQKDGAWIVQNSWGKDDEVAEEYYVSYEDVNIEKSLYGIINIEEKDNSEIIYQYDALGRNTSFSLGSVDTYGANIFTRKETNKKEVLKEISISVYSDMNYEIYINPTNGEISANKMQLVKKSEIPLENGYHTIEFSEPIELTGDKFVVAVKYIGVDETLVAMSAKRDGAYSMINSELGESFVGTSLDDMQDINNINEIPEGNICIKAFTQKEELSYSPLKGDVNLDGKITAVDLSLLKMSIVGLKNLKGYMFEAGDMNDDGSITAVDLSKLQKAIVGLV